MIRRKEGPAAPREFIVSSVSMCIMQGIRKSRVLSKRRRTRKSSAALSSRRFHYNTEQYLEQFYNRSDIMKIPRNSDTLHREVSITLAVILISGY